jgi:hypothetical protein
MATLATSVSKVTARTDPIGTDLKQGAQEVLLEENLLIYLVPLCLALSIDWTQTWRSWDFALLFFWLSADFLCQPCFNHIDHLWNYAIDIIVQNFWRSFLWLLFMHLMFLWPTLWSLGNLKSLDHNVLGKLIWSWKNLDFDCSFFLLKVVCGTIWFSWSQWLQAILISSVHWSKYFNEVPTSPFRLMVPNRLIPNWPWMINSSLPQYKHSALFLLHLHVKICGTETNANGTWSSHFCTHLKNYKMISSHEWIQNHKQKLGLTIKPRLIMEN